MKTSFVSNLAVQNAMRLTIQQSQTEVVKLEKEVTTGRHADVGIALGGSASKSLDLQRELARMTTLTETNAVVTQRLSASQEALSSISDAAQSTMEALIALSGSDSADQLAIAKTEVTNSMSIFNSAINTSFNGEFLFSGINTDVKPVADYNDPAGSTAKAAFNTALSDFMAAQSPPLTSMSEFSTTQMTDFIKNTLEPMYLDTDPASGDQSQWTTDWSGASDQTMTSRISTTEVVPSSTTANSEGVRKFALANVLAYELLGSNVSSDVRSLISSTAVGYIGEAISGIDAQRSALGISEARVEKANTSLEAQIKLVKTHVNDLEGVDTYEASTRMNTLLTQIETSYTLTSRLQQLSLINFL
ncbi:flagellar hook-associated protein 3 FlgL [Pararhizobium capsulatum DSM 1112]|uniref:Flagellin n=1 Tax=Pararhizobium capsulatum DSM 1112 TaxID=1121113 RepID=A0ABU0BLP6_9HYPH|nr:flagellar hook-associated family protein [Pararhizobium capsulatum]MDQ0319171.1 flagellar hook-associated protein 3 FlgL [Pararhizobium capsulatum DSM 1112]